jgi:putative peptidoglycan lipid II flippase
LFFQLPYGLFAVSLMTTIVPDLSTFVARADANGFRRHFALGLRLLLVVMVPAAVGSAVLGRPIVRALLEHGSYRRAAPLTGDLLVLFAVGMVGFAVYLYALRVFYTLKDTRTPFLVNCIENGVNLVGAVLLTLVVHWHAQGLAIAYSAAYNVAAVVALIAVRRRIGWFGGRRVALSMLRIVVASAVMGAAVYATSRAMGDVHGFQALTPAVVGIAVGIVVYAAMVVLLRVDEATEITKRLRHR